MITMDTAGNPLEPVLEEKSADPPKKKAAKKASKKAKPKAKAKAVKKASKKKTAKKKAAPKKKVAAKKKKAARKKAAPRARKKAVERVAMEIGPKGAPTILVVGSDQKVEPIWLKYSHMEPTKPSKRPGVKTNVRVGNLVSWETDAAKERIGVVQSFRGDSASVEVGGRVELIRVVRLTVVASKVKKR